MSDIAHRLINSALIKNRVFLYCKFWLDQILHPNKFIFQGKKITPTDPDQLPGTERKHILFPTIYHLDRGLAWQTSIAKACAVRGHQVTFMPLDFEFPRKNTLYYDVYDGRYASAYQNLYNRTLLNNLRLPSKPYSVYGSTASFAQYRDQVSKLTYKECLAYTYHDLPLGDMTYNSVMHYYRRGGATFTQEEIEGYRDYLAIGMILTDTLEHALDELQPDIIFTLNGSFIDSRIQLALATKRNIRVVTFEAGFMLNSIVIAENEPTITYPMQKYLPREYATYRLSQSQQQTLDSYLTERSLGQNCVLDYYGKPVFDHAAIRKEIGIEPNVIPDVLFTNLQWDSTQLNSDIAFKNQVNWILHTINLYKSLPSRTLVIRIHPAEVNPPAIESKEKILDTIIEHYPELPPNVHIIPPESKISSYPLSDLANLVLVYASTVGLESAIMGKRVLVAGRSHYRRAGFTANITSIDQYASYVHNPDSIPFDQMYVSEARKYAYFFFFGYMIPLSSVVKERTTTEGGELTAFNYHDEAELKKGKHSDLDFIIQMIFGAKSYTDRFTDMMSKKYE